MEEAVLAEDGILDPHFVDNQVGEDAGSCADQEYHCQDPDTISCYGCGLTLPCKNRKKIKDSSCAPQHYCKSCAKLLKSNNIVAFAKRFGVCLI
ncbi:histone-lysine N-methyltransferase ATX3 [Trifolium repens]|nr:histone-lysine N-methyltransferase ATX3 [Trifolium repens]